MLLFHFPSYMIIDSYWRCLSRIKKATKLRFRDSGVKLAYFKQILGLGDYYIPQKRSKRILVYQLPSYMTLESLSYTICPLKCTTIPDLSCCFMKNIKNACDRAIFALLNPKNVCFNNWESRYDLKKPPIYPITRIPFKLYMYSNQMGRWTYPRCLNVSECVCLQKHVSALPT